MPRHFSASGGLRAPDSNRPVYLRLPYLLLVFVGGSLGTASREALSLAFPPIGGVPVAILGVNLTGAFLLGLLLEGLVRRGPDQGTRRALRMLLGTGFLGGFTTYSSLATDTSLLLGEAPLIGIGYGLGTVVVGGCATLAGILLAGQYSRRRTGERGTP